MEKECKRIFHIAGNYIEKQEFTITGGTNYINTPEDNSERQQEEDDHTDGVPYELQKKGVISNLEKLQSQGLLDEDFRPVSGKLQVNQLAAIANKIGKAYNIRNYWKAFGALWGIDKGNLRSSFAQLSMDSIGQKEFSEKILSHIN